MQVVGIRELKVGKVWTDLIFIFQIDSFRRILNIADRLLFVFYKVWEKSFKYVLLHEISNLLN